MPVRVSFIYASTAGHTEYVATDLAERLREAGADVTLTRAERAGPTELAAGDILLLACGTWNTGGIEGQLNPHMQALLQGRGAGAELKGKPCLAIGLGDRRYRYTANAAVLLEQWCTTHGATMLLPALKIVDEPYDRLDEVLKPWLDQLLGKLRAFPIA